MRKIISIILNIAIIFSTFGSFLPTVEATANTKVRQEVNITDAYMLAPSGTYATSSEIAAITDSNYTAPTYYFEIVASTTGATTASFDLVNATSSKKVATITLTGGQTSYGRSRSTAFMPNSSSTVEYKVVANNEAVGKGLIASRIVVLQNSGSADLANTETQIEIGSATTTATNTATLPLQSPKYWYYDSSKWDASPTFAVDVTYSVSALLSSSTTYNVNGTYTYIVSSTTKYTKVEAWGAGGGGAITTTTGGGGGGGGAYAESTTSPTVGGSHTLVVGKGGTADNGTPATKSTYDTTTVVADFGLSATVAAGVAGGTVANSTGDVKFKGGAGGSGLTTNDTNGGGGGAGGQDGNGEDGASSSTSLNGAGGRGDNTLGGTSGTAAGFGAGTTGGNGGANALGGGGGGGSGNNNSGATGSNGGVPGGGGGGEDGGTVSPTGADGQIKLTETGGFYIGIALEESDGTGDGFQNFTFKQMIVTQGQATTSTRVRSAAFTPTSGRNYRLTASTTNGVVGNYSIYNAKVVVDQVQQSTVSYYYFNASIAGPTDPSAAYTNDANAFDSSDTTFAQAVSLSTFLNGTGTNAPTSGGTIISVKANALSGCVAASGTYFSHYYVDDGTGGTQLGTDGSVNCQTSLFKFWGATTTLSTPSGGWTWSKVNGLELKYDTETVVGGSFTSSNIYIGIIEVTYLSGGSPTLLQPQYLLAPFKFPAGTALQTFLTQFDTTEWSTTNAYVAQAEATDNSTSVVELDTSGGALVTNSSISTIDNRATSTPICLGTSPFITGTYDTKATTNNNDIYAFRVLVDVGSSQTAVCGAVYVQNKAIWSLFGGLLLRGQTLIR